MIKQLPGKFALLAIAGLSDLLSGCVGYDGYGGGSYGVGYYNNYSPGWNSGWGGWGNGYGVGPYNNYGPRPRGRPPRRGFNGCRRP